MNTFMIDLSNNEMKSVNTDIKRTVNSSTINEIQSFESLMKESLIKVNDLQMESDKLVEKLATGDVEDISEVVLASSRAELAMRMLMEVRNKLVEAYQQISRIQG
ncbi:MAG: flagellar hook-basal body complex protein FliE [Synergistaceae bacterium]|nr:flagellar hook-basal body complex protein FliE [Synergistaceae bacterium]